MNLKKHNIEIIGNAVVKMEKIENLVVRLVGWKALLFYADPCVFDRWPVFLTVGNGFSTIYCLGH